MEEEGYYGETPIGEERQNVHSFLFNVASAKDTTKLGFLNEEEIGKPKLPQRTLKELGLFCRAIMNQPEFADFFEAEAEIITSTSLSKDAKLLTSAILQKREVADVSKPKVVNKSWFKSKNKDRDLNIGDQ